MDTIKRAYIISEHLHKTEEKLEYWRNLWEEMAEEMESEYGVTLWIRGKDEKRIWRKENEVSQEFNTDFDALNALQNNQIIWKKD